jgi:hypothetical protein
MTRLSIKWIGAVMLALVCAAAASGQTIISITVPPLPQGEVGVAYPAEQFSATTSDGTATCCTFTASGLSDGLTLSPSGALSGTPTSAGTVTFTVTATDSNNGTGTTQPLSIAIVGGPAISPTSLPSGQVGSTYNQSLNGTGGSGGGYALSLATAPPPAPGVSFSGGASGTLSGIPTQSGTFNFSVQITDSAGGSATQNYALVINPAPPPPVSITGPASLPAGEVTAPYAGATFTATNGTQPYHWAVTSGSLAGLSLDSNSGVLGGTPTSTSNGSITVHVTDANSQTASVTLPLNIIAGPSINSATLPQGEVGAAYPQLTLSATGGSGGYIWILAGGSLPNGLSLSTSGSITGTPTAAGPSNFMAKVTDSVGGSATQNFAITVVAGPTITTSSPLPQGEVGTNYSQTLTASGGSNSGYTWSLAGGSSLPAGLVLSSGGVISGMPTSPGSFSFTIQVNDSAQGSATKSFSLNIVAGPTITTAPTLPNGTVNVPYIGVTLQATGGTSPYTSWSITSGALPNGLAFDGNSGTISGTPQANGTSNFTVQVTDSKGVIGAKQFNITVAPGLTIVTPPTLPGAVIGGSYSQTLSAAGGTSPYSWTITSGALPSGVTFSNGVVSGAPTSSGSFNFTVQVTDSASVTTSKSFTLNVAQGLGITTAPTLPPGTVGVSYLQTLAASGGAPPYTWTVTSGSIANLTLNAQSGTLSGTPNSSGTLTFTVQVADSASHTGSKVFSLSIAGNLAITTQPDLPSGGIGTAYNQPLTIVGGSAPYTWSISAGSLPAGLSLNPSSGAITGTPTSFGNFAFTVMVTDNNSVSTTKAFTLSVISALTITTAPTLSGGAIGTAYSASLNAVGGTPPYRWSITSGSLPAGLTFDATSGAITGMPTSAGNFNFTAQVTDAASVQATKAFTITVVAGLTITTAPVLPSGSIGVSYTVTLNAAGGKSPYTWSISAGALPAGLTLNAAGGAIFGTPSGSGTFTFTVQVNDSASGTASKSFTITIAAGLTITTPPALPNGAVNASYSQQLDAAGGAAPYHWSVIQGSLAAGVSLNASNGIISGAPTASGLFTFTVQVIDSGSASATKQFTINVASSLSITTPTTLPAGSIGVPYSLSLAAIGGTGPYRWALTSGTLPNGLTLSSSSGVISGTPTSTGTFAFAVVVTDSTSLTSNQQFTVTIGSGLVISTPSPLPSGSIGSAYSATLAAAGGTPAFRWLVTSGSLPAGLSLNPGTGAISGTPETSGSFTFAIQVTDGAGKSASGQFSLTVVSGLVITNGPTLAPGAIGQPYSLTLAAAGGHAPYTWSITAGLIAPGLALSPSDGSISGTPTVTGTFSFTVEIHDSNQHAASQAFTIAIGVPAAPQVTLAGVPDTTAAAQQIGFDVTLPSGYPLDITGTVTVSFQPDAVAPADDPAIQFSTGGRTANFTIPANATKASQHILLQTGTVSGSIKLTFSLQAAGANLPVTGLDRTIAISRSAPTIQSVQILKSAGAFQIKVVGFSTPRELTQAILKFTATAGGNLQTTDITESLADVGTKWFTSATSAQFGSQFILLLPFTATQGSVSTVASVSVELSNSQGTSQAVGANF